jgi:tRNA pseudouridine(55) synthase
MLIGHATKLSNDFIVEAKRYRARISFGSSTTTDDAQGTTVHTSVVPDEVFDTGSARNLLSNFLGELDQIPPNFSALKQNGKVAHREARKGKPLQFEPRKIEVKTADLVEIDKNTQSWVVEFEVSKGTYIRALARDIGITAHTHAHLSELRRLSSGDFSLEQAHSIEDLEQACSKDPLGVADLFLSHDTLLKSVPAEKLTAASVAGTRIAPSVLAIGVFDAVHAGHQALLKESVKRAQEKGLLATAMTFSSHPMAVVRPLSAPALLMSLDEKIKAIKACGVDEVIILPFNHKISQQSAEDFLLKTLPSLVQSEELIVGENFRCGKEALCSPEEMQEIFEEAGIDICVTVFKLKRDEGGIPYSSTRLRGEIAREI